MSVSFITNPEVRLLVNKKHLPKGNLKNSADSSHNKPVHFTVDELELLLKVDKLVELPPAAAEEEISSSDEEETAIKTKPAKKDNKVAELTLQQLKQLSIEQPTTFICDLIDISAIELQLPENDIVPRNPVLEERIQRLKAEQEQRSYESMTRNIDAGKAHHPEDTIAFQLKHINRQLIAVAQFVVSVLAGFLFGFLGVELMLGNLDFGFRLLLGIICALVIALAELYFLAKKLVMEEDYMESQKKVQLPGDSSPEKGQGKLKTN